MFIHYKKVSQKDPHFKADVLINTIIEFDENKSEIELYLENLVEEVIKIIENDKVLNFIESSYCSAIIDNENCNIYMLAISLNSQIKVSFDVKQYVNQLLHNNNIYINYNIERLEIYYED